MHSTPLAPGLLLAMPQLDDPHFTRAVVLMVDHDEEGSMGLIINQPSEVSARELLTHLEMPWNGAATEMVWSGGPVNPNTGWVLHEPSLALNEFAKGGALDVAPGIVLTNSPDRLRHIAGAPPAYFRILLGYAGWGPGQLAAEMASGAWLHAEADPAIVFRTPAAKMWEAALRSVGISPDSVAAGGRGMN